MPRRIVQGALLASAAFVLLACSGDGAGGDTGSVPGGAAQSAVAGEPLDTSGITEIVVARGYCGGAPGQCYGQTSYTVTFASSTLETTGCASGDAGRASATRALSADELQRVRDALAGVRVAKEPHRNKDGQMFGLTVTTASGRRDYSPEASCDHARFTKIVAGWDELWSTVQGL